MVQNGHVSGNQSQDIYNHELTQFDPCLSEMFLGLISFYYGIPLFYGYMIYRYTTNEWNNWLLVIDKPVEFEK